MSQQVVKPDKKEYEAPANTKGITKLQDILCQFICSGLLNRVLYQTAFTGVAISLNNITLDKHMIGLRTG